MPTFKHKSAAIIRKSVRLNTTRFPAVKHLFTPRLCHHVYTLSIRPHSTFLNFFLVTKSPQHIPPVLAQFPCFFSQRCVRFGKEEDWFIYWRSVCSSHYCPSEEPPQLCMLNYHGNGFGRVQSDFSMWAAAKTKRALSWD